MVTFSARKMTSGGRAKGVLVANDVAPTVDLHQRKARVDATGIAPLIAARFAGGRNAGRHG